MNPRRRRQIKLKIQNKVRSANAVNENIVIVQQPTHVVVESTPATRIEEVVSEDAEVADDEAEHEEDVEEED